MKLEYHKTQKKSNFPNKHLSVLCVVHCKVCRHSSCQHSQYDGLDVHQSVGSRIWNLLKGRESLNMLESLNGIGQEQSPVSSDSHSQRV